MSEAPGDPLPPVLASTIARLGLLPRARLRKGLLQLRAPEWLYDLCVFVFFPFNWLIAITACRFPSRYTARDWALDPALQPGRRSGPTLSVSELSASIRAREDRRLPDGDLWSLFDSLPAPSTNDMIGNWRGKVIFSGSWLGPAWLLEAPLGWLGVEWGKRFFSPYTGDPFVMILWKRIVLPVPIWGNVSLPQTDLRGTVGATMIYDHQPWKDYFRLLDDGKSSGRRMVLGNWLSREKNGGWFTLEELPEMDAAAPEWLQRSPY